MQSELAWPRARRICHRHAIYPAKKTVFYKRYYRSPTEEGYNRLCEELDEYWSDPERSQLSYFRRKWTLKMKFCSITNSYNPYDSDMMHFPLQRGRILFTNWPTLTSSAPVSKGMYVYARNANASPGTLLNSNTQSYKDTVSYPYQFFWYHIHRTSSS